MSLHGVAHISVRAMKVKNIGMISSDEKTWSGQRRILIVKKFDANGQENDVTACPVFDSDYLWRGLLNTLQRCVS
jgi:hypothetical protein